MANAQIIEGTSEKIADRLTKSYAGQKLRVFVEPEEENLTADLATPPDTVRDRQHLLQLLREGLDSLDNGEGVTVTSETWKQAHLALDRKFAS